jgi:hypothetical protein
MREVTCARMADLSAPPPLVLSPEARADSFGVQYRKTLAVRMLSSRSTQFK